MILRAEEFYIMYSKIVSSNGEEISREKIFANISKYINNLLNVECVKRENSATKEFYFQVPNRDLPVPPSAI